MAKMKCADHVDLKNGILYGHMKQIRCSNKLQSDDLKDNPPLIGVWCAQVVPSETQKVVGLIRDLVTGKDPHPLLHLKRFDKIDASSIRGIICSVSFMSEEEVRTVLSNRGLEEFLLFEIKVPEVAPPTKDISIHWSEVFWPTSWKGDPNHQYLNSIHFNLENEKLRISNLLDRYSTIEANHNSPLVTIIARETEDFRNEILTVAENQGSTNPYDHSVMRAIANIADAEKERRNHILSSDVRNYLCHNLIVYTTHEPCVMCSMALVHSRIARVTFLKDSPKTGGLSSNYQLGDMDGLNWKFDIWKWVGSNEAIQWFMEKENSIMNY